ncbi:MAG: hypothetical protein ACYSSM_07770 [Planctomycetota bacterium]
MSGRRVVVTGIGAATALGLTADELWNGLLEGLGTVYWRASAASKRSGRLTRLVFRVNWPVKCRTIKYETMSRRRIAKPPS